MVMKNEGKGQIYYGMHFYPGVAQYQEDGKDPYRVFLNEDTIRTMDTTFAGRPVFLLHVDGVDTDINELKKEADGWVIESFYNSADGKHWAKFIVVSDKAEKAIANGMKLSNCYIPKRLGAGGEWNGLEYDKEIIDAEYEHLAIVPNPRYIESIIMTPDEFKQYNEDKINELKKLSNENEKSKGVSKMKLSWFKKTKVENSTDFESMSVTLPQSKLEVSILKLINDADEKEMKKDEPVMADLDHHVMVGDEKMKINDLVEKYKDAMDKLKPSDEEMEEKKEDDDDKMKCDDDDSMQDSEDEDAKEKALELAEHEEKEIEAAKKKNEAREKANRLKNAHKNVEHEEIRISLSGDQVARGKSLYGSN